MWADAKRLNPGWGDEERYDLHWRALGPGRDDLCPPGGDHYSLTRMGNRELDAVYAELLAVTRPADINAQVRQQQMPRRRALHALHQYMVCLALYVDDVAGYVAALAGDKFGCPAEGEFGPDDLAWNGTEPALEQLIYTLAARLDDKRAAAGDSVHAMKVRAGMPCDCRTCCSRPMVAVPGEADPF